MANTTLSQREYWEARALARVGSRAKTDAQKNKEIAKAYQRSKNIIVGEVNGFFDRYQKDKAVTIASSMAYLSKSELKALYKALNVAQGDIQGLLAYDGLKGKNRLEGHLKYLEDIKINNILTRKEALLVHMENQLVILTANTEIGLQKSLTEAYSSSYDATIDGLGRYDNRIGAILGSPSPKAINKAIGADWKGSDFSSRLWDNKDLLIKNIERHVTSSFVYGLGPKEASDALAADMGCSYNNAARIYRTESSHVSEMATQDSYADAHIERYQFIAGYDERLCDICGGLHEKTFAISEGVVGVNLAPMHPNCRCTSIPVIKKDSFDWIDKLL